MLISTPVIAAFKTVFKFYDDKYGILDKDEVIEKKKPRFSGFSIRRDIMKIYVISGKARHGKDTVALDIKEVYEKKGLKVINLAYGSYIKEYAKRISNWDGSEETKPRERTSRTWNRYHTQEK